MMNATNVFLLSLFVLLPILIGIKRFKNMDKIYYPFFILLVAGFINEVISFILIRGFKQSNAPANNIYSLFECCLILYQFYLWNNSKKKYRIFVFLVATCVAVWIIENILNFGISWVSTYFDIFYAFVIILLSINQINTIMMRPKGTLLKNPQIILCVSFITLFIYQIINDASKFISNSPTIHNILIIGFSFINFATNMLFTVAMYLITYKSKEKYEEYFRNR